MSAQPSTIIQMNTPPPQSNVVDLGYSFKAVKEPEFLQSLRQARVMHHNLPLNMRIIKRNGATLGTVYLAGEDPVAFYGANGTCYVRAI